MLQELSIESMIYNVRGEKVMLDSDLAKLYNVETKRINEAVKNNPEKFPERFSFVLNNKDIEFLKSKISTSSENGHGGRRKIPRVFTEQGIWMLSTILKSKESVNTTIMIMDTFVSMRKFINKNIETFKDLGSKCFSINEMEDKNILNNLLFKIKKE